MVTKWASLYDDEQKKKAFEKKLIKKKRLGITFKVKGISPHELLNKAKYSIQNNGGYIRHFTPIQRFHAYIVSTDAIELHTDKVILGKEVGIWHVSSIDMVTKEIRQLKSLFPTKVKGKNITLKHDLMKKAFEELRKENEKVIRSLPT